MACTPIELRLHPCETVVPGPIPGTTSTVPAYVGYGMISFKKQMWVARSYQFYFAVNLVSGCCLPHCVHPTEVGRLTVLYDDKVPVWVYFGAHGMGQGMWVAWDKCEKTADGWLVVYVARGSHAFYPRAKTYWRKLGLSNDCCSPWGKRLRVTDFVPANAWKGHGPTDITSTVSWIPSGSITPWKRFFLPWYQDHLRFQIQ